MILISFTEKTRTYYTTEWDTAKAFERFYDGDFNYAKGGYTVTI